MTDTGQVPGEGLPENAGMVDQPGVLAPGAYTYLDPSESPADDDLLLLPGAPGAQGAWGNEVPPPAPMPFVHEPGAHEAGPLDPGVYEPGSHEPGAYEPGAYEPGSHEPVALVPGAYEPGSHDAGSHEAGAYEPAEHEALSHEPAVQVPLAHEPVGHESLPHEPVGHESLPHEPTGHESLPHVPAVSEPLPHDAVGSESGPHDAAGFESLPQGSVPHESAPDELGPHEPDPHEPSPPEPGPHEPGPHEAAGRDSGSVDLTAVRMPEPVPAPQPTPPRRPLHLGPPTPDGSSSPVRSLADRGPAGARVSPAAPYTAPVAPARHAGPPTAGPEYLDVRQLSENPPRGAMPWGAPSSGPEEAAAETVVPEAAHGLEPGPAPAFEPAAEVADGSPQPETAQDAQAREVTEAAQASTETAQEPEAARFSGPVQLFPVPQDQAHGVAPEAEAALAADGSQEPRLLQPPLDETPFPEAPHTPATPEAYASVPASEQTPDAEFTAPEQNAVPEQNPDGNQAPEQDPRGAHATPQQVTELTVAQLAGATDEALQAPSLATGPVVHIPDHGARFADTGSHAEAPHSPGHGLPQAQETSAYAAPELPHGVPAGVGAYAQAPHTAVGQAQGEHFPAAPGDVSELPGAPLEPHANHSLGQFVPVEGTVPTTPHLAPTPPHAMTVPPFPTEEQHPAEEPAAENPQVPLVESELVETEFVAPVPAPREAAPTEAEAEAQAPSVPEPLPAAVEAVVAQQADDLDTQGADQEESTAAVADVRESTGPAAPGYDDAEREAVLRVMRERRDIRKGFRSDPIPHDVLLRVLEAAHTAPSVGHSQPWDFVVIRSADTRRSMHELAARQREAYAKSLPKGRAKQFKELKIEAILDTPVNIVVTADPTRGGRHTLGRHTQPQMAPYSSALAVENLWLAARAEGLGVGWVSFFDEREMVRALGLPEHLEVVAYLCVGYVDEFPDEPELMQAGWSKRRPLSWVVHEETYGRRALPGEEPHDLLAETISNIRPLDAKALGEAWERQKRMTKPAGALGMLEIISAQLSGLSRMCPPPIPEPAAVAIFAGDHGVHAQGVTHWPQEVTAQMVANFLGGGAVCNAFANQVGAEVCVIDVGVASDLPATPGLLPRKIRAGTADMTTGPALTREEVVAAIEVGIETARDLVAAGNKALLTGEMGIANTTASAALISVFTGTDPSEVTGRGTGINDEMLARKTEVVRRAIDLHQPDPADPIGVLAAIGGLEHAAMVGLLLGGASLRTPVILDGVSAGAAALVARAIAPEVLAACIAGHRSAEPGHVAALNKLGLRPLVDLDLRLGEGTGALLALPVVQSAARAMHEVATFDSAGVTEK
ncbi:nicotinate-nucleotide--dimethylbenzimidazole phosphoribosyltransferase [Streptomyces sp. NPDC127072]|uniref:nicotinate-nucleotide--dimethylbenzimidazole phosphoribosyltransferase n=1 Tax=Streptomyces sp. NPDC127072 TaxID=3347129 RepID=UPI00364980C5